MYMVNVILIATGFISEALTLAITRMLSYVSPVLIIGVPRLSKMIRQQTVYNAIVYMLCGMYFIYIVLTGRNMLPYGTNYNFFTR